MPDSTPPPPALSLRVASRSDVGMRRSANQDSLAVSPAPETGRIGGDAFLMVADGMGAHAAGELASKMATDAIPHTYQKAASDSAPSALRRAIREANAAIHAKGASSHEFGGMGTTCSCLVVTQGSALIGHVGDSRVYRLRGRVLEQLTFDHSLVWEMAKASNVSADKVPTCIPKNVITRSLGPHETVNIDLEGPHQLEPGDAFLLCSDGLTGVVDDPLIGGVLSAMGPEQAAETLIDLANLRGGPDNISVVVACVDAADPAATPPAGPSQRPVGGGAVVVAALCLLGCVWFAAVGNLIGAAVAAAGLGAAVAYSVFKRTDTPPQPAAAKHLGGPYGDGPYRRTECGDLGSAAGDLRDLVRELSDLKLDDDTVRPEGAEAIIENHRAASNGHVLDWTPFQDAHQKAEAYYDRGDYAKAIVAFAAVVRHVLESFRDTDSTRRYKSGAEVIG